MARRISDVMGRLYAEYHTLNDRHFAALLPPVHIIVRRIPAEHDLMLCWTDPNGHPRGIIVDDRYATKMTNPWAAIRETLLHEMIHVWQAVRGEPVNHGPSFRRMARRVGISTRAVD